MNQNLFELLRANPYPGRGIVLGMKSLPGASAAVMAYWIMGRSANSRNRIFSLTDDGIRTEAYDPSKVENPSLIIYHPVRMVGSRTIVTNGDQTDTIRDYLLEGKTFADALRTREFEPDEPNFTPRISGLVERNGFYALSVLKASPNRCPMRQFFEYVAEGDAGHFISTYQGDGNPLPSFAGEPIRVSIDAPDADTFAKELWDALNEENRISLFVRYTDLRNGFAQTRIINKFGESFSVDTKEPIWK